MATHALAAPYQVVDLGDTLADGLSAEGVVVGSVPRPAQQAAVLAPDVVLLGFLPGGTFSHGNGVSGTQVVGYSSTGRLGLQTHAFLWTAATGVQDLGTAGDPNLFSAATALNGTETIVGYADDPTGQSIRPFLWIAGQMQELETLGGPAGFADAINDFGDIVGESQTVEGHYHATLWYADGRIVDLHTTGGPQSFARALNNQGQVVGGASMPQGFRAFLWTAATGMQDLGLLPGDVQSTATGINDAGVIVGSSAPGGDFPPPPAHAVVWVNDIIEDLNTLIDAPGWVLEGATAINAAGMIVGLGHLNGEPHAFLLLPSPDDPPHVRRGRHHHHHRSPLRKHRVQVER